MYLPNAENSYIPPAKILNYLLADDHPKGGSKADFLTAFGFNRDEWQILAQALHTHEVSYEVASTTQTIHGMKFTVEGSLETLDGHDPNVRTAWIILNSIDKPRLVTAHPLSR